LQSPTDCDGVVEIEDAEIFDPIVDATGSERHFPVGKQLIDRPDW
jgi:hypothetical protein